MNKFEKRFVAVNAPFINLYVCERGIFVFGNGGCKSVQEIENTIAKYEEKTKEIKKQIECLKDAITLYKENFSI